MKSEWLEERRKLITGTDAAAILGKSKWKTPLEIWDEKVNGADHTDPSWVMRRGLYMEVGAAPEYARATHGRELVSPQEVHAGDAPSVFGPECGHGLLFRCQHIAHAYVDDDDPVACDKFLLIDGLLGATPDAFCSEWQEYPGCDRHEQFKGPGLVEVKTARDAFRELWLQGGIPDQYAAQLQHGLMVSGLTWGSFLVMFWDSEPIVIDVPADLAMQENLRALYADWWERHVVCGNPPDPTAPEDRATMVRVRPPSDKEREVRTDAQEVREASAQLLVARTALDDLGKRKTKADNARKKAEAVLLHAADGAGKLVVEHEDGTLSRYNLSHWTQPETTIPAGPRTRITATKE